MGIRRRRSLRVQFANGNAVKISDGGSTTGEASENRGEGI